MSRFQVQRAAGHRLDEIYVYTRDQWGEEQAERYISGLFTRFTAIANREFPWRTIPAAIGVQGFFCRYEHHVVYWKTFANDEIGIVTVLHERMHQMARFREEMA